MSVCSFSIPAIAVTKSTVHMHAYVSLCMSVLFPADVSKKSQFTLATYFYLFMYL